MKKLEVALVVGLIILLVSVLYEPNSLGDKYYYMDEFESIDIGSPFGKEIYLKKGDTKKTKILGDVIQYEYNKNYIIAKQVYNEQVEKNLLRMELGEWSRYYIKNKRDSVVNYIYGPLSLKKINKKIEEGYKNPDIIYKFIDSIITYSPYYQELLNPKRINYYIIDKKIDSVYGPFSDEEFIDFKEKENINLNFNKTNSAKKLNQLKNIFK